MSRVTKIIQGLLLVILMGAWSNPAPNPGPAPDPGLAPKMGLASKTGLAPKTGGQSQGSLSIKDPTSISTHAIQPVSIAELLAKTQYVKSPSYSKSEPLLLLLSGIAIFIAATSVKRVSSRWTASRWAAGRKRSSQR